MNIHTETDIERLRAVAELQGLWIDHLTAVIKKKCSEIDELRGFEGEFQATLALAEAAIGAARGDQQSDETSTDPVTSTPNRKPPDRTGSTPQPKLTEETLRFELDEPDKTCPSCGGGLEPFAGQFDHSELIDVSEVTYRLIKVERQKYVCRCGGCVETAPGPLRLVDGGRYSIAFAAKVAADKYVHHIPLARQSRMMNARGLEITSQTLWDQLDAAARLLTPSWEALRRHILAHPVIGLDQTGWPSLDDKARKPWQMWCLTAPMKVWHSIRDDKSAATFSAVTDGFAGVVVCDALESHAAGARAGPGDIVLAGCWAHVKRKFDEALPAWPEASFALARISALYVIEEDAHDDTARATLRTTRSAAVLDELKTWLMARPTLRKTAFARAVRYTLVNWGRLTRFVDDVRVPLDNNATERALRGPVVGRRNHFGSKSRRGTEVASVLYSLAETAKLHGVEPQAYFEAALRRARSEPGAVCLPWEVARG